MLKKELLTTDLFGSQTSQIILKFLKIESDCQFFSQQCALCVICVLSVSPMSVCYLCHLCRLCLCAICLSYVCHLCIICVICVNCVQCHLCHLCHLCLCLCIICVICVCVCVPSVCLLCANFVPTLCQLCQTNWEQRGFRLWGAAVPLRWVLLGFDKQQGAEYQLGLIPISIWCYLDWISGLVWRCQEEAVVGVSKWQLFIKKIFSKYFSSPDWETGELAARSLSAAAASDCSRRCCFSAAIKKTAAAAPHTFL